MFLRYIKLFSSGSSGYRRLGRFWGKTWNLQFEKFSRAGFDKNGLDGLFCDALHDEKCLLSFVSFFGF